MLVQNWIRKINLRNNEKSAEVYRTGTGTVTFTNQNCDIYAYYGKDFWMALEQSKSNTIIRTSVCSSHDCVKQNPILLMFRYDRIFQNLVLIMEMKWDTLHSFHQYRIILGRGVKSALLKGKNSVVDYLVTVVCTRRVNNAVFPLQQRARSQSNCHDREGPSERNHDRMQNQACDELHGDYRQEIPVIHV